MTFRIIIPVRYASDRMPGKPLMDIAGKSILERVYSQCMQSGADSVVIATEDEPSACRSNTSEDVSVDAYFLYLPFGPIPSRSCYLLGLEQYTLDHATMVHYEAFGKKETKG